MIKNTQISTYEKIRKVVYLIFNHLFWAGGPLIMFFIGYIPGFTHTLDQSLAVLTVPLVTSIVFTVLLSTIIFPSILSIHIMRRYVEFNFLDYIKNFLQWLFLPILMLTMFSIPAIESQIRLFLGKRIDSFDTTVKMDRNAKK